MGLLARYLVVALASAVLPARCYEAQQPITPHELSQPLIGFGTWNLKLSEENTTEAVSLAIQAGYRQIDCAAIYGNEKEVGRGIADGLKKANISREELWVTSKLWNSRHGDPVLVESGLMQTLDDLGLDYVDLYLMHWPVGHDEGTNENRLDYVETWRSMVALPTTKAAHIGVANFSPAQLREIISKTTVKPYAHQMELHPYLPQSGWVAAHKALGISVTAYSPFGNTNPTYKNIQRPPPLLKNDVLVGIAEARNCTPAQVALAWGMGRETSVIPKSSHPEHILENLESSKCILQYEDLARLRLMGRKYLTRFSNPSRSWGVKLFEGLEDA